MDKEEVRKAKMIICSLCDSDMCEWCVVERIAARAENDEQYVRSSTNGDYSPSNPWDAPGMSASDFI